MRKKSTVLFGDLMNHLAYVVVAFLILLAFWNILVTDLRQTTVAEEVQMYLRTVANSENLELTYHLPKGDCKLEITRTTITFYKEKPAFWKFARNALIGFLFGFLPLGKGGGFVGAVIGTWFCFLDAKETISNPVGDEMERDRVEIRCLPSEEVPVKFTNENGKIKVFALVAT